MQTFCIYLDDILENQSTYIIDIRHFKNNIWSKTPDFELDISSLQYKIFTISIKINMHREVIRNIPQFMTKYARTIGFPPQKNSDKIKHH